MTDALRPLFLNEGAHGGKVMGHPRVEDMVRTALAGRDDVAPRFLRLPPEGRATRLAIRNVPLVGRADIDLQTFRWHATQSARAAAAARRALDESPADVLHVTTHSVGLLLGRLHRRLPVFLNVDVDIETWQSTGLWRPVRPWSGGALLPSLLLEARAFGRATAVLAWTDWAAAQVRRRAPEATVHVLHPGLDLEVYRPARRRERDRPRLLFVGGRFVEKGGDDLLAALDGLLGDAVDLDVVTRDEVPSRPGLRVHRLDAGSGELIDLFQQADALCLPSRADAVPWVVLEAMACGTPVLASDVGAIPEMLGDGGAGTLVVPGDRRALREAVLDLAARADRWAERGRVGRRRCEEHYDGRVQTERLLHLLRASVAAQRP